MRQQKAMNIKDLLNTSSLASIMQKGQFLHQLNQQLQALFPKEFQSFYRLANIHQESLTIEVANAVVRQGFLFRQAELLRLIQHSYPDIKKLHFKINPELGK